jgi:hypothetical protein
VGIFILDQGRGQLLSHSANCFSLNIDTMPKAVRTTLHQFDNNPYTLKRLDKMLSDSDSDIDSDDLGEDRNPRPFLPGEGRWLGVLLAQPGHFGNRRLASHRTTAEVSTTLFYAGYNDYKVWEVKDQFDRFIVSFSKEQTRELRKGEELFISRPELEHLRYRGNTPFENFLLKAYTPECGSPDDQFDIDCREWTESPSLAVLKEKAASNKPTSASNSAPVPQGPPKATKVRIADQQSKGKPKVNKSQTNPNKTKAPVRHNFASLSKPSAFLFSKVSRSSLQRNHYFMIRPIGHQSGCSNIRCLNKEEIRWAFEHIGIKISSIVRLEPFEDFVIRVSKLYLHKMPKASEPILKFNDNLGRAQCGHALPNFLVERFNYQRSEEVLLFANFNHITSTVLQQNQTHSNKVIEGVSPGPGEGFARARVNWENVNRDIFEAKAYSQIMINCSCDPKHIDPELDILFRLHRCKVCDGESGSCGSITGECRYRKYQTRWSSIKLYH